MENVWVRGAAGFSLHITGRLGISGTHGSVRVEEAREPGREQLREKVVISQQRGSCILRNHSSLSWLTLPPQWESYVYIVNTNMLKYRLNASHYVEF